MLKINDPLHLFIAFILTIIAVFGVANYLQDSQYYSVLASSNSLLAALAGNVSKSQVLPPLTCTASLQRVDPGMPVTFTGTGGSGLYEWVSVGSTPATTIGRSYTTTFTNNGPNPLVAVVVMTDSQNTTRTAFCNVTINPVPLACSIPTITSIDPPSVALIGPGALDNPTITLTINGTNFVNGSTISFGGSERVTTFVSSTQLTITVSGTEIRTAGTKSVRVISPRCQQFPNLLRESNTVTFTIAPPAPTSSQP